MYQNKPDMRLSTCNTTPPTNTTSRAIRLLSTHSSPARQQPLSKMLCSTTPNPPPPTPCQGDWLAHPSANYTTQQSPVITTNYASTLVLYYYSETCYEICFKLQVNIEVGVSTAQNYSTVHKTLLSIIFWLYNLLPFVFIKLIQFGLSQK